MITLYVVLQLDSSAMAALQFLKCCTALFWTLLKFISEKYPCCITRVPILRPIIWLAHRCLQVHSHLAMGIFFVWPQSRALYFESNGYFAIHTTSDKTMMAVSLCLVSLVWTERIELNSFANIQQKRALKMLGFELKQIKLRLLLQSSISYSFILRSTSYSKSSGLLELLKHSNAVIIRPFQRCCSNFSCLVSPLTFVKS